MMTKEDIAIQEKKAEIDELTEMNKGHIIGCPCYFCIRNAAWNYSGISYRTDSPNKNSFEGGLFRPSHRRKVTGGDLVMKAGTGTDSDINKTELDTDIIKRFEDAMHVINTELKAKQDK